MSRRKCIQTKALPGPLSLAIFNIENCELGNHLYNIYFNKFPTLPVTFSGIIQNQQNVELYRLTMVKQLFSHTKSNKLSLILY